VAPAWAADSADATELAAGDKAAAAKDWASALAHYRAAGRSSPSASAQLGAADALYQLGRLGEAYETYDDLQRVYGPNLGAADRAQIAARLKELTAKTGWLSVRVSESGAEVALDGEPLGTSPLRALVRVAVGRHELRVTKGGFAPFAGRTEVGPDRKAVADVTLSPQPQAHLVVEVAGGQPLRVLIDGVDVGAAPWEGDVAPGPHEVVARSSTATTIAQRVDLESGGRVLVDLTVAVTAAHLQVRTSDGKGFVYVDGALRGEGTFSGELSDGPHLVTVAREGYRRFEKTLSLARGETRAETVTLEPETAPENQRGPAERALEGIYGGFGLAGAFGVGGQGTEIETDCSTLGANRCDTPSPLGGAIFGYVGWTWNPVGFELVLALGADTVQQTAQFDGVAPSGAPLPASMPARKETFTFARFGGVGALRARATFQNRIVRGTVAGGVGVSYRELALKREATETDGVVRQDVYAPGPVAYLSPALVIDGSLQVRLSRTVGLSLGVFVWADSASVAGSNATSPQADRALIGSGSPPAPIATPSYHLATGPQVLVGPFIGLEFGP
jgi:hypothetical protein